MKSIGILVLVIITITLNAFAAPDALYVKKDTWVDTMLATRNQVMSATKSPLREMTDLWLRVQQDFPLESDWLNQDLGVKSVESWFRKSKEPTKEIAAIRKALAELEDATAFEVRLNTLEKKKVPISDSRWLSLYIEIAQTRRLQRLQPLIDTWPAIVFTKHFSLGGSHYAYTEDLSDSAYPEREKSNPDYRMGASLCLLHLNTDGTARVETLYEAPNGVIRDPDVSYDGKRVLFSCRTSNHDDDFHLYEIDIETRAVRQLTDGLGYADYEGIYLPNGDLLFNSTRCIQIVDCWWTDVSNLYTANNDGNNIRRVSFDQVHTNFPTVMEDGRVIYTRWDYNDRGQLYPQPLLQMNPDGTAQTELYGNNAWFPTTLLHSRGIPGTNKIISIASGHHSHQRGKLCIIDPTKGRQEAEGIQLIAPIRMTKAVRVDAYGQDGDQFQYPYPLNERQYLVTYSPYGGNRRYQKHYALYFMDIDGNRELLVSDPEISCNQSIPLAARSLPHTRPSQVNYAKDEGTYYVQDIYTGPGLAGVERGSIDKLRVVALDFRAAGVGHNSNQGEAGGALVSTPIATGNGSWDPKIVLGEAKVHEDGSALFKVPARTPVYFQAIDKNGHVAQTMRSWSTLQPGEFFSCVGCHEDKNQAPPALNKNTQAMLQGTEALAPFHGVHGGFSFTQYVQPILDKHCIQCHDNQDALGKMLAGKQPGAKTGGTVYSNRKPFSLKGDSIEDDVAGRYWSEAYLALTNSQWKEKRGVTAQGYPNQLVNWITTQSRPDMLPPYHAGSAKSELMTLLREGHGDTKLNQAELDMIACWIDLGVPFCGDYTEAAAWDEREKATYERALDKRRKMEALDRESIRAILAGNN